LQKLTDVNPVARSIHSV